ncbi:MAG TPA: hypothetical protein VGJ26_21365 [Pirellulales bacterium]|jgi:hypothetical protein
MKRRKGTGDERVVNRAAKQPGAKLAYPKRCKPTRPVRVGSH